MSETTYPPFAPDGPKLKAQLSQGEKKRTGHIFADCALYGLPAPKGKVAPCPDCVAAYRITAAEARAHQAAFDAAWRSAGPVEAERTEIPKVDVYEAVVDVPPPARRDARPNKFGGKCVHCAGWVEAGAGALGKNAVGQWVVAHLDTCPQAKPEAPTATAEPLRAGAYRLADGQVVRIQISKASGKPYALALDETGAYLGGGRLLVGAVRLSLDEAKAYGRETGTCCVCGAHLENPESVALGIGPICGGRQ